MKSIGQDIEFTRGWESAGAAQRSKSHFSESPERANVTEGHSGLHKESQKGQRGKSN